jgi:molecular chaperone DnaK
LTAASHKLAEAMYKSNAAGPSASTDSTATPGAEEKKEEGVIDAEYVDVADKK